jgi:hypothetical protein
MITELCDRHRAIIGSAEEPAFRRLVRNEMVRDEAFRRAIQNGSTEDFEPLCCHVGDSAVTDAKLDRPGPEDPALDPKKIPKADKLIAADKTEE